MDCIPTWVDMGVGLGRHNWWVRGVWAGPNGGEEEMLRGERRKPMARRYILEVSDRPSRPSRS